MKRKAYTLFFMILLYFCSTFSHFCFAAAPPVEQHQILTTQRTKRDLSSPNLSRLYLHSLENNDHRLVHGLGVVLMATDFEKECVDYVLYRAAEYGYLELFAFLVDQCKMNVYKRFFFKHGQTCLHIACCRGHTNIVRFLVRRREAPCLINERAHSRKTPLHIAAEKNRAECIELLIDAGADIWAKCDGNYKIPEMTPLQWAINCWQKDAVVVLIKNSP